VAVPPPTRVIAESRFLPYLNDLKEKRRETAGETFLGAVKTNWGLQRAIESKDFKFGARNQVLEVVTG